MGRGKVGASGELPARLRDARDRQQARDGGETRDMPESRAVAEALASLHPDHRDVLVETYYRGSSVDKAAAALGIPAGTVKSRTFYALKAFQRELQGRGLATTPSPLPGGSPAAPATPSQPITRPS